MNGAMVEVDGFEGPSSVDVHAHYLDPVSVADMAAVSPTHAPRLGESATGWSLHLPASLNPRKTGQLVRPVPSGLIDLQVRAADLGERDPRQMQVLTGHPRLNFHSLPGPIAAQFHGLHNDGMIRDAKAYPDRFLAMAGLPMQNARLAVDEIERVAAYPEVCGVGIGSNVNGRNLDDPEFEPVWEALDAFELPVLVHPCGVVAGEDRLGSYHLINLIGNPVDTTIAVASVVFSGVLERYERLRFCFVHGGGFAPYQVGRWDHGWRVRSESSRSIDRLPSTYVARCFFDSLTHDARSLHLMGERFGWDHVLLGSDYPWSMATETPIQDLLEAGLSDDAVSTVALTSAQVFLRWPHRLLGT